jgi:hypothetical protein
MRVHTNDFIMDLPKEHASADSIREFVGESRWEKYYKFAIVRNPWEWEVSLWAYIVRHEPWLFRDKVWFAMSHEDRNYYKRLYMDGTFENWLFNFQWSRWSPDGEENITNVSQLDWVNKDVELWDIDNLEGLIDKVEEVAGIHLNMPRLNKTLREDTYWGHYSPGSYNHVRDLNVELIKMMGYKFACNVTDIEEAR